MQSTHHPMEQILEAAQKMPLDDQEWLLELLEKRYHEARRAEIVANARQTLNEHQRGQTHTGTVDTLFAELDTFMETPTQ